MSGERIKVTQRRPGVVVVGSAAVGIAEAAVEAAGAHLLARLPFQHLADPPADASVLLVEAADADADLLAAALPHVRRLAKERDLLGVVAFEPHQIDIVARPLLHPRFELLCDATALERVVALTLALRRSEIGAPTHLGEEEAAGLVRLRAEVSRIADALARLVAEPPLPNDAGKVADRELGYGSPPPDAAAPVDPQAIRRLLRARRMRDRHFGTGLFEDPAWDMLLDLYAAHGERTKVSVSSLCIAAAVAPTTALRWIGRMVEAGLFVREADPADRRRALVGLSDRARTGMTAFYAALTAAGLPLV